MTAATPWSERMLARAVALQVLERKCLVLVDNCSWTGHECDVLAVTRDLRIIDVEIKISRADLKADAKKEKWWHRRNNWAFSSANAGGFAKVGPPAPDTQLELPQRVWKHYYAFPKELWKPELLDALPSKSSGVLLFYRQASAITPLAMTVHRRATPDKGAERITPADALDIARLASLRMWDAYQREESMKAALAESRMEVSHGH